MTTEHEEELLVLLDRIASSLNKIAVALYSVREYDPDFDKGPKKIVPLAEVIDQEIRR